MARIFADVPDEEHKYLKMCCVKLKISMRKFITQAIVDKIEEYEDKWTEEKLQKNGIIDSEGNLIERGPHILFEEIMEKVRLRTKKKEKKKFNNADCKKGDEHGSNANN